MIRSRQEPARQRAHVLEDTPEPGLNSGETAAAGQLRAFVERIEHLEAEIKEINSDKSDIYKEMRDGGFDVKTVRKIVAARKIEGAEREEQEAIFDLYWAALTGSSRARAREEGE